MSQKLHQNQKREGIVGIHFKGTFIPTDMSNVKLLLTASSTDQNTQDKRLLRKLSQASKLAVITRSLGRYKPLASPSAPFC